METQEKTICSCIDVAEREIIDAIRTQDCDTLEKIGEKTGAGTSCGKCKINIENILKDYQTA